MNSIVNDNTVTYSNYSNIKYWETDSRSLILETGSSSFTFQSNLKDKQKFLNDLYFNWVKSQGTLWEDLAYEEYSYFFNKYYKDLALLES